MPKDANDTKNTETIFVLSSAILIGLAVLIVILVMVKVRSSTKPTNIPSKQEIYEEVEQTYFESKGYSDIDSERSITKHHNSMSLKTLNDSLSEISELNQSSAIQQQPTYDNTLPKVTVHQIMDDNDVKNTYSDPRLNSIERHHDKEDCSFPQTRHKEDKCYNQYDEVYRDKNRCFDESKEIESSDNMHSRIGNELYNSAKDKIDAKFKNCKNCSNDSSVSTRPTNHEGHCRLHECIDSSTNVIDRNSKLKNANLEPTNIGPLNLQNIRLIDKKSNEKQVYSRISNIDLTVKLTKQRCRVKP
ncbi:unnamed protein product [Mytilus coruscus]|uniref:Uncharacterized protein n=1 Tax=Mytilus coruscus TaxID=42192 RepID=A0A6J8BLF8_MYTCO|nr:unnamed protein product [Mytilus coruscus]